MSDEVTITSARYLELLEAEKTLKKVDVKAFKALERKVIARDEKLALLKRVSDSKIYRLEAQLQALASVREAVLEYAVDEEGYSR